MEKNFDYEASFEKLTNISNRLANGKLTLDESVTLFESAEKLYKDCFEYLEEQSGQVFKIKQDLEKFNEEKID